MTFIEALKACFTKYAEFKGRALRSEFWWFFLFVVVVQNGLSYLYKPLSAAFGVAVFLPLLAVHCRRLHDINRTGWWILMPMWGVLLALIPGAFALRLDLDYRVNMVIIIVAALSPLALLFIWCAKKGDPGLNRFGPPPQLTAKAAPETVTPAA